MRQHIFLFLVSLIVTKNSSAQSVAINTDGSTANASAILDIKSTAKGLLIPRMTTAQRNAIASPANGLMVFDITLNQCWYYNGAAWTVFSTGSASNYWTLNGSAIYNNNTGNVGIGTSTPINKLQIGILSGSSITGNDIAIGNGTQAMSFFQSATNSFWYTTNNFALMPGVGGTGNLGIGTTTPATKLTVQTLNGNYGISHTDGSIIMATYIGNGFGWIGTRSNHPLAFFSNNSASPQMTLLANGNVGVGTTTPATKFTIRTPNNSDGFSHETDGGIILKDVVGGISAAMGTYSNHIFRLVANSVAVINIEPSGSVGVGISGAVNKLQVGSMGATGFNGNDIAIGNGTHATGFSQSNAAATFVSTTDIVFLPRGNGHGRIGINTNTPRAPLDVSDYTTVAKDPSATGFYGYLNFAGVTGTSAAPTTIGNVSIYSSGRVYADEFDAFSDGRIKDIAGISNTVKDLEIINSLHITDYTMKDKVKYGAKPYKKVIAQEVEKVYPQVISKHTDFIPNVYQLTYKIEKKNNGYLLSFPNKHNISNTAKKLRVLLSGTEAMQEVEIVAIPSDTQVIITAPDIKSDKVFVYGEEVDDFRTVDYEGLTTLNISATQELSRLLKEQEKNNEMQNKKIAAMEAAMELLKNNAVIPSVAGK